MIKNKKRFVLKLFIMVWLVLLVHVVMKLTFNYWQPYVIPTAQLQVISDFIDNNLWLKVIINGILYFINAVLIILCGIQEWKFKSWTPLILILASYIISVIDNYTPFNFIIDYILSIAIPIALPLLMKKKNWFLILITTVLSNVFMALSLWLEGFVNSNDMNYIVKTFLELDYYIMLAHNYILFNLIKKKEGE